MGRVLLKIIKFHTAAKISTLIAFGVTAVVFSDLNHPQQNLLSSPSHFDERVTLGADCFGRSDYPHISTHVPGTVNVMAETSCPGKKVSVRTTLSRRGWLFFRETVSRAKSDQNSVKVSVALKCKWKPGQSPIEYIVESIHQEGSGGSAVTRLHRFLKC
jgi:hypothetical protein